MKPSLQLKLRQSLTLTPQLHQALRLLQLSSVELHGEIQEALDSNMMLELDEIEETADEAAREEAPFAETTAGDSAAADMDGAADMDSAADMESMENATALDGATDLEAPADTETPEVATPGDIPDELPVDTAWDEIYDSPLPYTRGREAQDDSGQRYNGIENHADGGDSLAERLLWQLDLSVVSDTDRAIAVAIIDSLDDDGYLSCSLEDIHSCLDDDGIEMDEIQAVLHRVQALGPAGVAARDLRECLSLQLKQLPADTAGLEAAKTLVERHLPLLAARDYPRLARVMKLEREPLQEAARLIQSMQPRPGAQAQQTRTEYVVPDVYARKDKGVWRVELNTDALPRLRINPGYAGMIRRADNSADNQSLKTHLQEARWFLKSLQSRGETLLRVATGIVERQRAFLERGEEAMKPLVLHDIAAGLGLHESTVSRVTSKKYMHTPRGIFELKYFFSSHLATEHGDACSSTAIRALIKKLIQAETPQRPLSDSKLRRLLSERGIRVARRTVAKYRETMSIPPSHERKRIT